MTTLRYCRQLSGSTCPACHCKGEAPSAGVQKQPVTPCKLILGLSMRYVLLIAGRISLLMAYNHCQNTDSAPVHCQPSTLLKDLIRALPLGLHPWLRPGGIESCLAVDLTCRRTASEEYLAFNSAQAKHPQFLPDCAAVASVNESALALQRKSSAFDVKVPDSSAPDKNIGP